MLAGHEGQQPRGQTEVVMVGVIVVRACELPQASSRECQEAQRADDARLVYAAAMGAHAVNMDAVYEFIGGVAVGGNGQKVDPMIQPRQFAGQRQRGVCGAAAHRRELIVYEQ